jgi:two-component system cell cycle sensor histidine kinase/response regulator CckA
VTGGLSAALAVGLIAMAAVAMFAAVRAQRAEAALRASAEAYRQLPAQGSTSDAARSARDEQAHHAQIMEDVGRTADDLAHDLKNLLTAITGRTELLIASLDEAHPGRPDAYEIRRLALSAARAGKPLRALSGLAAATDVVDVNLVTSRTTDALKEMLGSDIDVSVTLDPGVMPVRLSAGHLEEIVLNLAMNARAAMPDGGRLTVSTARHTRHEGDVGQGPAREYVRIVLADTGAGMPEADRARLLEPSLVPGANGVAVGLARVLDIVKQASGRISVDSAPELGTTFVVDLRAEMQPTASHTSTLARSISAWVLVVDDEPRVRELIKGVLARDGHDVVAVAGPHDGLAVLKRQPGVELMLVDVVMPDMSGYDLAIQARTVAPGLRVVFMSGFARDLTRHPPGDRFLAKPFAIESLHEVVRQALSDQ